MDDIAFLEGAIHRLSNAIGNLRNALTLPDRQNAAFEVIETAEELNKAIAQTLPEIERQAVLDAQMEGTAEPAPQAT